MSTGGKVGITIGLLLLLAAVAVAVYVYRNPLKVFAWSNERALVKIGLARTTVDSAAGPQTYFAGGNGQTVVLLHGAGDSASSFAAIAGRLTPRYRLVVPDLAGHGSSAPTVGPLPIGRLMDGVIAVLNTESSAPVIIVGNSLGAWLGCLYALAHPERVSRLVLVNGGPLIGERPDLSLTPRTREEAAMLMTQLRDSRSMPVPGFVLDEIVRTASSGPIGRIAQAADQAGPFLLDGKLQEVRVPADLLWGESDKMLTLNYARKLMDGLPASRLTTIDACGHIPHQECPEKFATALLEVLAKPAPKPASVPESGEAGAPAPVDRKGR